MRLQVLSDLHLERYPDFMPRSAEAVDVLVLAGDIGSYQAGSRLTDTDFGLTRFSPGKSGGRWPRVLFVPGNHEYDGLDFDATRVRLRHACEALGIEWLDQEQIEIGPVRFVGSTLWADFEALAQAEATETRRHQALGKAFRAANFYLRKNTTLRGGQPMLAEDMRTLALECQQWLGAALARPFAGSTVVVTHFAPSLRSSDPRYGMSPGTAGFCNALDGMLAHAQLWIHGHLHCPVDYVSTSTVSGQPTRCRVVANPRGYHGKGEQAQFRESFVVEVT
jgi:hypothetical protein